MKKNGKIFISSTFNDLIQARQKVDNVITGLEYASGGMEKFGSSPDTPLEKCLEEVAKCDLLILIVALRYGSIEVKTQKSYTQLEYEKAIELKIPVLVYLSDSKYPASEETIDFGEKREKLNEFKRLLRNTHTIFYFKSEDELAKQVAIDIPREMSRIIDFDEGKLKQFQNGEIPFEKFLVRPKKYDGIISTISFGFTVSRDYNCYERTIASAAKAINMATGDTIELEAIIDEKVRCKIFFQGEYADWLEREVESIFSSLEESKVKDWEMPNIRYIYEARVQAVYGSYQQACWDSQNEWVDAFDVEGMKIVEIPQFKEKKLLEVIAFEID